MSNLWKSHNSINLPQNKQKHKASVYLIFYRASRYLSKENWKNWMPWSYLLLWCMSCRSLWPTVKISLKRTFCWYVTSFLVDLPIYSLVMSYIVGRCICNFHWRFYKVDIDTRISFNTRFAAKVFLFAASSNN